MENDDTKPVRETEITETQTAASNKHVVLGQLR
jgi:hypothetical protein